MERNKAVSSVLRPREIQPFQITQALVALGLEKSDDTILKYMDFLTCNIPTSAAYFMHVISNYDIFNVFPETELESGIWEWTDSEEILSEMEATVKAAISKEKSIYIEYDIKEGNALQSLLLNAQELKTDLLVIGQRGGTSAHGILAKNLARRAKANALIIPEEARIQLETIVVPVDFSPYSLDALKTAVAIKKQMQNPVRVIALHVYSLPNISGFKLNRPWIQFQTFVEANIQDAFKVFLNAFTPGDHELIETALVMKEMPGTARYIRNYGRENKADLIILGAKGHSQVERMLLGSVTEKMLSYNDPIPIMVVK